MMQACNVKQGGGGRRGLVWFLIFWVVAIAVWQTINWMSMQHAIDGHGSIAVTIRRHCENNPKITLTRQIDGHTGIGCEYAPNKWGVMIKDSNGKVVTAFPNKSKTLEGVLRYLSNRGYQ